MSEHQHPSPHPQLLRRIEGEYLEMPGLRLTCQQARRLLGLDEAVCAELLGALVDQKFLALAPDGRYTRFNEARNAPNPPRRMVKASDLAAPSAPAAYLGRLSR
jgi:hypothetical protein